MNGNRPWGAKVVLLGVFWLIGVSGAMAQQAWWTEGFTVEGYVATVGGYALDVDVTGGRTNLLLGDPLAASGRSVAAIDTSNPQRPTVLGYWTPPGNASEVLAVNNSIALWVDRNAGPAVVRLTGLSNVQAPQTGASITAGDLFIERVNGVLTYGPRAYILVGQTITSNRLVIMHVGSALAPVFLGALSFADPIDDVTEFGDNLFVLSGQWLYVYKLEPGQEMLLEKKLFLGGGVSGDKIAANESLVFIYDPPHDIALINWTAPPNQIGWGTHNVLGESFSSGSGQDLDILGSTLFLTLGRKGVQVLDMRRPFAPDNTRAYFSTPSEANGLKVQGNLVYVATGYRGLTILRYLGELPPVAIVSVLYLPDEGLLPAAGQSLTLQWRNIVQVAGTAAKFEIWRNGVKVADLGIAWDPAGEGYITFTMPALASGGGYVIRASSLWDTSLFSTSRTYSVQ